jgi:ABC-2 type transport system ATP-binding protein
VPIIELHHLTKTYKSWRKRPGMLGTLRSIFHREYFEVPAVKDLSFTIEPGEMVGFLGPNGAGKTTTLKMLSGILWPTSGTAQVLSSIPWERKAKFQRKFSIVMGQKNQLWWDLPSKDSFLLNKAIYEIPTNVFEHRVRELAGLLDTEHLLEIPVRKLSLGERMKCELMNALLHHPDVLFLDEPTIGLDVISQQSIREFLRAWNREKQTTIILTSHTMADVEALCERVIIINHGSMQYDGSLRQLLHDRAGYKEVTIVSETPLAPSVLESFGTLANHDGNRFTLHIPHADVSKTAKKILDQLPVSDLLIENPPLEEVIRDLFVAKN